MSKKRGSKFKKLLKNNLLNLFLFMVILSVGVVIAADVVVQEGDFIVDVSDFFVDVSSGLVGIGTASPSGALDVAGNTFFLGDGSAGDPIINFDSGNDGSIKWEEDARVFQFSTAGTNSFVVGQHQVSIDELGSTNAAPLFKVIKGDNSGGRAIAQFQGGDGSVEAMWIGSDGLVGIGTTIPQQLLNVKGDFNATGDIFGGDDLILLGNNIGISADTDLIQLSVDQLVVNGKIGTIEVPGAALDAVGSGQEAIGIFKRSDAGAMQVRYEATTQTWAWRNTNAGAFQLVDVTASNAAPFQVEEGTPTNTLYLDSGGKVGIGNSAPNSLLELGTEADAIDDYLQIDSEAGAPPSTDCDENGESGRMIIDHTNDLLYICNQLSGRGWDTIALTD